MQVVKHVPEPVHIDRPVAQPYPVEVKVPVEQPVAVPVDRVRTGSFFRLSIIFIMNKLYNIYSIDSVSVTANHFIISSNSCQTSSCSSTIRTSNSSTIPSLYPPTTSYRCSTTRNRRPSLPRCISLQCCTCIPWCICL